MNITFDEARIQMDGGVWLCLKVKDPAPARAFVMEKKAVLYDCQVKQHREKRSRDANNYCWVLLDKLASALRTTKEELYIGYVRGIGPHKDFTLTQDEARTFRSAWERLGPSRWTLTGMETASLSGPTTAPAPTTQSRCPG